MKRLFILQAILFLACSFAEVKQTTAQAQTACCPEFVMEFPRFYCQTPDCSTSAIGQPGSAAVMCQYSTNKIQVVPGISPGFTYSWVVTGGTINGNILTSLVTPTSYIDVTWGSGTLGTITVTIYNADSSCFKVLTQSFCLTKSPKALFVKNTPNTVCKNQPIVFTNTSLGVYTNWYWNFGDGTSQNGGMTVTHSYPNIGTYIVSLTVSNGKGGDHCGCSNTFYDTIIVNNNTGLSIYSPDCRKMFCAGDTVTYCSSITGCGSYNWSALGGTVIGSGPCIKVVWNLLNPSITNPTVTLVIPPGCAGSCGNTASFIEKILYNGMPIQGNSPVCVGAGSTYSLPALPGVFYNWTVTPAAGVSITNGTSINTPTFGLTFTTAGNYLITVTYIDSLRGCKGVSTKIVNARPPYSIQGPTTSCVGCTSTFNTNTFPVANFNWNINTSPAINSLNTPGISNTWTPSQVGTFVVTATQLGTAYCNSPQQALITVAPKPVLAIFKSALLACPGTIVKFWVTSTVPETNVTWTYPPGTNVLSNSGPILDTISLSFVGAGPYIVTATQQCKYTCSQTSISTTVNNPPAPAFILPKTTVCIDEVVTYNVTPVAGISYNWTITNPNLGTIQGGQGTPSVQVLWHGNGTNSGFLRVSHCGGFAQIPITVTLPPVVTIGKTGACLSNGVGYTLTAFPSGQTYLWSNGPTTQVNPNITAPGVYTVIVNPGGGGSCPVTKSITILPDGYQFVIAPPCVVTNCNLASFSIPLTQLLLNINCAATLQWYYATTSSGPFSPIPGATGANHNATVLGCYKCVATCTNGCNVTSNTICIPDDIYFCCTTPSCSSLTFGLDFTSSGCNPTTFNVTYPGVGSPTGNFPVHYCYGDGTAENLPSNTATHQYAAAGQYMVCIATKTLVFNAGAGTNDTCCISRCKLIDVPVVARITASYNCFTGVLSMSDNSTYFPNNLGATYTWSVTGGTYIGTLGTSPSEAVTPTSNGNFVITLSVTKSGCTSTTSVVVPVFIPNAVFTVNPNPTCSQNITYFVTAPGYASYVWLFGDGAYSYATPAMVPQHAYTNNTNAPINFTATLTVTTPDGCTATSSQIVSVHPKPIVTITPNPWTICKGGSVILTANVNQNGNTMCSSYNYQWMLNGANITGANAFTYNATTAGLYSVFVSGATPSCNCTMTSDTAIISLFPVPIANIETSSTVCFDPAANPWSFNLTATNYAGYTYNWSSNNGGITFAPNNSTSNSTTATGTLVNNTNFVIYLQVVDGNGCVAYDSLCIYTYKNPNVAITALGSLCANSVNTLSVIAPAITNSYLWNTGANGTVISTSLSGNYSVTATDLLSGCTAFSNSIFINQAPSLALFPIGCDTLCSDRSITIPLAQLPNLSNYFVQWHDGIKPAGPIIYAGFGAITIPGNFLSLGIHHLWATVTFPNGCTDSSGVYDVFIKKCCVCAGSSWAFRQYSVDNGATYVNWSCNNSEVGANCNPVIINAAYNCSPNNCAGTVAGQLLDNLGNVLVNILSLPYTYTPTPGTSGVVYIKLFGYCNGVKCDSCILPIFYHCPPVEPPCACNPLFHFNGQPIMITPAGIPADGTDPTTTVTPVVGDPTAVIIAVPLVCGTTYANDLFCLKNYKWYINFTNPWPSGNCQAMVLGEVLLNGNVVFTQPNISQANPLSYTFPGAGNYCIRFKLIVNGVVCDVCMVCFKVVCNVVCDCRDDFRFTGAPVIKANLPTANIIVNQTINCNTSLAKPLMCNTNYSFWIPFSNPYTLPCIGKDSAVIKKVGNAIPLAINPNTSISNPLNYTFTQSGTYCVTHYLVVNGKVCASCTVCFTVECPNPCNCNAFDFLSDPTITFPTGYIKNKPVMSALSSPCQTSLAAQLQCRTPYNFFITAGPVGAQLPNNCDVTVKAILMKNNVVIATKNNVSPSNPLNYTFSAEGIYCIKYEMYVKGVLCKTCTQCFFVKCCPIYYDMTPLKGNFTGCVIGGTTQIYHDSTGGTFRSLNPAVATVDNNGNVTAISYGTAIIVYTWTKYPCDYYVAATYTVRMPTPLPPITGNAAICNLTQSVNLSITGDKGMWSSSDPTVASVTPTTALTNSTVVTGVASGQVTITFTTNQSGCPVSQTRNVVVHNLLMAPITGPLGVCKGRSVQFENTNPIPGNFTSQWLSLNNNIASVNNNGVVTGMNTGATLIGYYLNYANPNFGTCTATAYRDINVYAIPNVPNISYSTNPVWLSQTTNTLCSNQSFVLQGNPSGGVWSAAGSVIVNASGVVTTIYPGIGMVTYTVYNSFGCSNSRTIIYDVVGCNVFSATQPIQLSKTNSIVKTDKLPAMVKSPGILVYPNPAHARVFFHVDAALGNGELIFSDVYGKELQKSAFKSGINTIETGRYPPGMYFVTFKTKSGSQTQKLVIE